MKKILKLTAFTLLFGSFININPSFGYDGINQPGDKQKSELQLQCEAKAQACNQNAEERAENRYLACYYAYVPQGNCELKKENLENYLKEQCNQMFEECFPGDAPVAKVPN